MNTIYLKHTSSHTLVLCVLLTFRFQHCARWRPALRPCEKMESRSSMDPAPGPARCSAWDDYVSPTTLRRFQTGGSLSQLRHSRTLPPREAVTSREWLCMRPRIQVVVQEEHQVDAKLNLPNMFGRPRWGAGQAFEVPWPNVTPHISLGTLKSHVWNGQMLADCLYIELDEELELALDDLSIIVWLWDNGLGELVVRPVLPCNGCKLLDRLRVRLLQVVSGMWNADWLIKLSDPHLAI